MMTLTTTIFLNIPVETCDATPREFVQIQHHGGPRLGRSHFTAREPQIHVTTASVKPVPPGRHVSKSQVEINLWYKSEWFAEFTIQFYTFSKF
jgi:hypothetical protein